MVHSGKIFSLLASGSDHISPSLIMWTHITTTITAYTSSYRNNNVLPAAGPMVIWLKAKSDLHRNNMCIITHRLHYTQSTYYVHLVVSTNKAPDCYATYCISIRIPDKLHPPTVRVRHHPLIACGHRCNGKSLLGGCSFLSRMQDARI